jgi:biotin synthase-like enzyme
MMMEKLKFEQGPIRPPNESRSFLLRLTRNCPWNQCRFCPVYKDRKFSLRSIEEIKQDILTAREMADEIKAISWRLGFKGEATSSVISQIFQGSHYSDSYRSIAIWLHYGTGACFLQDADNLIMKTKDLVEVVSFLKKTFPEINRVTTYSRSRTIARKSIESLRAIREAGLDRIHVGLETGYDPLLKFMKKGVTGAQHIEAGQKVLKVGMELSEYIMPGLGGQEMWKEHAIETAKVLNEINPHFIRIRSLRVPDRIPLARNRKDGSFTMQTDDMVAEELRVFIENLKGITSMITSDHIMNLLEEVTGKLPEDKQKMLDVIRKYQNLTDYERVIYRVGRRGGVYHSTDDLERDAVTRQKIETLIQEIMAEKGAEGIDPFISELVDQYV